MFPFADLDLACDGVWAMERVELRAVVVVAERGSVEVYEVKDVWVCGCDIVRSPVTVPVQAEVAVLQINVGYSALAAKQYWL